MIPFSISRKIKLLCTLSLCIAIIHFVLTFNVDIFVKQDNNLHLWSDNHLKQGASHNVGITMVWKSHPRLKRALTKELYDDSMKLMETFVSLCEKHNVTFIMADGTLLGSYFFHNIIPWDDDLDVMVKFQDREKLIEAFVDPKFQRYYSVRSFGSNKIDYYSMERLNGSVADTLPVPPTVQVKKLEVPDFKCKIFKKSSKSAGKYKWNFPFIDIKYYLENNDTIWKLDKKDPQKFRYLKRDFYPLHPRPFGQLWLPAPRDTRLFLKSKFKRFRCRTGNWNHIEEKWRKAVSVPSCTHISKFYPHVIRTPNFIPKLGVVETLFLDNEALHAVNIMEEYYKANGHYSLT